jgi:hypothetical protein
MKHKNLHKALIVGALIILSATVAYSQKGRSRQLPNGTIIYADGTIKHADGTIKYPDGRIGQKDGSIKYPDGSVHFPNRNPNGLPPGQAKKKYGSQSAKPFAPGQQKKVFLKDNKEKGRR